MKTSLLQIIAFFVLSMLSLAEDSSQIQIEFQENSQALKSNLEKSLKQLSENYTRALEALVEKSKAAGNLDSLLTILNEIKVVQSGIRPLPDLDKNAPLSLRQLRRTYIAEREKIAAEQRKARDLLINKTLAALKEKEKELTKAGEFDAALNTRKEASVISESIIVGKWIFVHDSRDAKTFSKRIDLQPDGKIGEGRSSFENSWKYREGVLYFYSVHGQVRYRFTLRGDKWMHSKGQPEVMRERQNVEGFLYMDF